MSGTEAAENLKFHLQELLPESRLPRVGCQKLRDDLPGPLRSTSVCELPNEGADLPVRIPVSRPLRFTVDMQCKEVVDLVAESGEQVPVVSLRPISSYSSVINGHLLYW